MIKKPILSSIWLGKGNIVIRGFYCPGCLEPIGDEFPASGETTHDCMCLFPVGTIWVTYWTEWGDVDACRIACSLQEKDGYSF